MLPPKNFDKNSAIWCILSVPKLVIINLKINIFFINQQPKLCANFFFKTNPDAHFGTKINTFTLKEDLGGGGLKKMLKLKKCKKWRLYVFHTRRKDVSCNDVDSDPC